MADDPQKQQGQEQKPEAHISFFVRNEAAGKAMARRKVIDRNNEEHEAVTMSWNWRDTWQQEHKRAFVVAKMAKADMLTEVHDSLQKALDEGKPFEEWQKEIVPKLEGKWLGKSVGQLWDELSDEEKAKREPPDEKQREKVIAPERLELIFRTNMAVANAAGHYEQLMKTKAIYPYWRYVTRHDARVRDAHRDLHTKVFKWDDPFWETYFPPNGFRCRCHVSPLTKRQVERDPKLHIEQSNITEDADGRKVLDVGGRYYKNNPGWDYNPGDSVNHLVSLAKDSKKGRPAQVQADLEADLAKKEAEEAAAAKAKAEAEKARQERERQAQEVEKRLQEAQAKAEQRRAEREAKKAERQAEAERAKEAQRLEKEAAERQRAAETAQKEAQQREADQRRDAEVQKVLRQAREVQGAPVLRQTAKTAEIKIDTYVVQDKVRLRKDTPVPAKEERKFVKLASKFVYQQHLREEELALTEQREKQKKRLKETLKHADSEQMTPPISKMAGLKKTMGHSKTEVQGKRQAKTASVHSAERLSYLAEEAQTSNQPQHPSTNKGVGHQELDRKIDELKSNGNYPLVHHDKPFPYYREKAKFITDVVFPNPGYTNIEHAQAVIRDKTLEHAVIFSKGNKCLVEVVGDERNVALSVRYKGEPYIAIHNHPHGSIFSPIDIGWAIQSGVHELRVVCKGNGIYSFSPGEYTKAMPGKNAEMLYWSIVGEASKDFKKAHPPKKEWTSERKQRWGLALNQYINECIIKQFPGITRIG